MNGIDLLPLAVGHMIGLGAIGSCLGVGLLGSKFLESPSAGTSGLPPKVTARCGSDAKVCAPNLFSSAVRPNAPS